MKKEIKTILQALLILFVFCLLLGCKTNTVYVPVKQATVETVTVRDTIIDVKIEFIRDSIVTPDSLSFLSNRYAYTYAEVKDGYIQHSLSTWPESLIPTKVQYIDKLRVDSIPAPYPVEVIQKVEKDLSWWQNLRMRLGEILMVLITIGIVYMIAKRKN